MFFMVAAAMLMSSTTAQPAGQDLRNKNETRNDDQAGSQYDQAAVNRATTSRPTTYQSVAAAIADQSAAAIADQSAAVVTADEQPAADQPAADQPAADQPAVDQPAGNQSAVNQSATAAATVVDKQPQPQHSSAEQHGPVGDHNNVTAVHGFGYTGIAQADQADRNHHAHRAQAERVSPKNNVY